MEKLLLVAEGFWKLESLRKMVGPMLPLGDHVSMHSWVLITAACFVAFTIFLSSYLLFQHLSTYNGPEEQRWLIGLIFMVPVYSSCSFLSLYMPEISMTCNTLTGSYEALAMYSFGRYLIGCLGGEDMAIERLEKQGSVGPLRSLLDDDDTHLATNTVAHVFPFNWCLAPWVLGRPFYDKIMFGIVQYMILKTVCSWLALILDQLSSYGDGEFGWSNGYSYVTLVLNFSQMWALYCLVQFYHVTKYELQSINPLAKFLCFKAVVFVTWWQGVILAYIFGSGLALEWFSRKEIFSGHLQSRLQDFIICIEMAFAAVAHIFVYPAKPYKHMSSIEDAVYTTGMLTTDDEVSIQVGGTSVKQSVHDVVFEGGGHVVDDVKVTVSQAVEPFESGITKITETFHETFQSWSGKQRDTDMVVKEETIVIEGPIDNNDGHDDTVPTDIQTGALAKNLESLILHRKEAMKRGKRKLQS